MKYYCKNCGGEFNVAAGDFWRIGVCPLCGFSDSSCLRQIPAYETVAQWEARKGEKYPDTAPVYVCPKKKGAEWIPHLQRYGALKQSEILDLVVATEAGAPPDDWSVEGGITNGA